MNFTLTSNNQTFELLKTPQINESHLINNAIYNNLDHSLLNIIITNHNNNTLPTLQDFNIDPFTPQGLKSVESILIFYDFLYNTRAPGLNLTKPLFESQDKFETLKKLDSVYPH